MAGQSGENDEFIVLVILAIFLFVGGYAIWYFFDEEILSGLRWLRYIQMEIIIMIFGQDYTYVDPVLQSEFRAVELADWMAVAPADTITTDHIGLFSRFTLDIFKWPVSVLLLLFMIWSIFRGPGVQYHRKLDLEGLIQEQAKAFPTLRPFVHFNPLAQEPRVPGSPVPAELPLFAEALSPEEWLAYHAIPMQGDEMDEAAARAALVKQLGSRWRGIESLRDYEKALLAAFALKSRQKRKEAEVFLDEIAECWDGKKGFKLQGSVLRKANKILRDADLARPIYQAANRHAYVKTAMITALKFARDGGGVLASAQFLWLRGHDRGLWYALNGLGRQSFHAEAMATLSHYTAEKSMGRPIPIPQVEDSLKAFQNYIKEEGKDLAIPKLDYKDAKNRRGVMKPVTGKAQEA